MLGVVRHPIGKRVAIDLSVGVAYPVGMLLFVDAHVSGGRRLSLALGTSPVEGGVGWRVGIHGAERRLGPLGVELWTALYGLSADEATSESWAELRGAGHGLFQDKSTVSAVWAGPGVSVVWRHGERQRWLWKMDIGALMLLADRYPPERDYPVIPSVTLRYGYAW